MRKLVVISLATIVALAALACALFALSQPDKAYVEIRNAYYPFTVELQVRDR